MGAHLSSPAESRYHSFTIGWDQMMQTRGRPGDGGRPGTYEWPVGEMILYELDLLRTMRVEQLLWW